MDHIYSQLEKIWFKYAKAQPHCIFVMGCIASGKTSYIYGNLQRRFPSYEIVVFDEIMTRLASFETPVVSWPPEARSKCYTEALEICTARVAQLQRERKSYIVEGTGLNLEANMREIVAQREAGYKVSLHYIPVSLSQAYERTKKRNGEIMRTVQKEDVAIVHEKVLSNVPKYARICDEITIVI